MVLGFHLPGDQRAGERGPGPALVPRRHGARDQCVADHRARRHGDDPGRADRAGHRRLHLLPDDGGRRAAVRLEQGEGRICLAAAQRGREGAGMDHAGAGRQRSDHPRRRRRSSLAEELPRRLPPDGHQLERIGARKPLLSADGGRGSARAAAARRGADVERADRGADRQGQRGHPRLKRTAHHLWGARRQGGAAQAAGSLQDQDQGPGPVLADRHRAEEPGCAAQGHRQGRLRHRCRSARHALRGRQGVPGIRRQAQELRLQRHQGPSRHPLGGRDRRQGPAGPTGISAPAAGSTATPRWRWSPTPGGGPRPRST